MIINRFLQIPHTNRLLLSLFLTGLLSACQTLQPNAAEPIEPITDNSSETPQIIGNEDNDALVLIQPTATPILLNDKINRDDDLAESLKSARFERMRNATDAEEIGAGIPSSSLEEHAARELENIATGYLPIEIDPLAITETVNNDAWKRLRKGMQMSAVHNKRVKTQLNWYLKHPGYLQRVMERARPVLPFILDELENRNLPTELALLPIVESAYQTFAYSHGRASGMWQIIPSTGRFLGLKQNWWYDGRRDIIESTKAAMTYLDSLAKQFNGDWELALASYNAGPGRIRSAIRHNKKRNKPTDFWHLTKIRKETRNYVPKLMALKVLFENPQDYDLDLLPISNETPYVIVDLDAQIDLALAADLAGISINELYQLNPAFNRWATAPKGPHRLLLPKEKADQFKTELGNLPPEKRINWVRHKIKSGETLSHISRKYRTTTALIKSVNKIRGTQIRAGKYLMVPTATRSLKTYTLSQNSRVRKTQNTQRSGIKQYHIVRSGQSLWSISRRYGVTTAALAKWNAMAPIDTLRIGQKLVIWTNNSSTLKRVSFNETGPNQGLHALRYTVRKGDSLSSIASRFKIRVADIKRWNTLGKYLHPGQKIKLYVDITRQSG